MALPVNFRDVGQSINTAAGQRLLKTGLFFRSAWPEPAALQRLQQDFGIQTILDLRSDTERLAKHDEQITPPAGQQRRIVDFNGRAYTTALMKQLTYWQATQLIVYYALGYRREAISIIGTNVMARRGVVGLAQDSLVHCTAEIKAVFDVLAAEGSMPLLIHCTQGKDRTGLITLLVLLLLQVPLEAIAKDYLASQSALLPERKERLREIRSIGLPEEFADCDVDWPAAVVQHIEGQYGGITVYLQRCGVDAAQQKTLIAALSDS